MRDDRDLTGLSDEDLLRRFIDGSEAAFTDLVRRHEDRIFALALRMVGDRALALDATQDAFLAAFRRAQSFRGDSAFGTWLYRIAINACKDLLRKKKRWGDPEEAPEEEGGAPGPSVEDSVSERLDLVEALGQLPEEYREAVVMYDLGGIPYEEIARITSSNLGTVKSRISRGRRRLAELMEQPRRTQSRRI